MGKESRLNAVKRTTTVEQANKKLLDILRSQVTEMEEVNKLVNDMNVRRTQAQVDLNKAIAEEQAKLPKTGPIKVQ